MNQVIILVMFIVPWFTLFLMPQELLNRFISAGLFTGVTSGIIYEVGLMLRFWYFKEIPFPLIMYGTLPVMSMWVLRFTYGRLWVYMITNAILDLGFAFGLIPWWGSIGIFGTGPWTGWIVYGINFLHSALIYTYQVWWEKNQIGNE